MATLAQPGIHRTATINYAPASHIVIPLAISAVIYIGLRSPHLHINRLLIQLVPSIANVRELFASVHLPAWFLFTLPDALWVYALTSWLLTIWGPLRPIWIGSGLMAAFLTEYAQLLGILAGTYDPADLLGDLGGFAAALLFAAQPLTNYPLKNPRTQSLLTVAAFVIIGLGVIDSRAISVKQDTNALLPTQHMPPVVSTQVVTRTGR